MSMHLEGPWLSTTGKRRAKPKFASAEAKRRAEELSSAWEDLKKTYERPLPTKSVPMRKYSLSIPAHRTTAHIPSKADTGGIAARAPDKVYTGTKVKGIGTMHKSNAVPVFSDEEAVEISTMRRG
jgi:hypothetical protein